MFLADTFTDLTHHDKTCMNANTYRQTNAFFWLQASVERAHGLYNPQPGVYGTLCVPNDWSDIDIQDVIADIDDKIVRTADPFRDDFVVTAWRGSEVGVYSDEEGMSEDGDLLDDEDEEG